MSYYSQLALTKDVGGDDPDVNKALADFTKSLADSFSTHQQDVATAAELAGKFSITVSAPGDSPEHYDSWRMSYVESFEKQFPMSRIDHYYFFYGRKLSEIACSVSVACVLLTFQRTLKGKVDFAYKIEKCLKDCEFILFRLTAAAALLSSEPRHGHFRESYRLISEAFDRFRYTKIDSLDATELDQLCAGLTEYGELVNGQARQCADLLKELGV